MAIKLAIIAPFQYMGQLCPLGDIELAFTHLLSECQTPYSQYYFEASKNGRFIIQDNSIMELGYSLQTEKLLDVALRLRPALLTPPEVLHNGIATLEATVEFLTPFEKSGLYPTTQLLGIAHGRSFAEWVKCFEELVKLPMIGRVGIPYDLPFEIPGSESGAGANHLEVLVKRRIAVCQWIKKHYPHVGIHLLGLAHASELREQSKHDFVISNDSSLATMSAIHGIRYETASAGPFEKFLIDFNAPLNETAIGLAKHNINIAGSYAR